jgi:uncharacterized protein (DUF697 family)
VRTLTAALGELRSVAGVLRDERDTAPSRPVVVSGMLAEQLARLLADGAEPSAVLTSDTPRLTGSCVVVHIIAGDPSSADEDLALNADRAGIPIVLVQLWPQEDWTRPFLLTPFIVECSAGAGFPVPEIAGRIAQAVERPAALARRVPVLKQAVASRVVRATAIRAAILGIVGSRSRAARPLITLEQVRMLAELRNLVDAKDSRESLAALGGTAASVVSAGFVFREVARNARRVLPGPLANATVAAAGTWILGEAFRRLEQRLP